MSALYFTSQHHETRLSGAERAYMGLLCGDIALAFMSLNTWGRDSLERLLPKGHYLRGSERFADGFSVWFRNASESFYMPDDSTEETFAVALNTVLATCGDALKLLARLHGQCEIHAYVEEQNREWVAQIIDAGRAAGVYREGMGWESVAELLRNGDGGPVVTHYSVTDNFPNAYVAGWEGDGDAWCELPISEQWAPSVTAIREQYGLELKPENWQTMRFRNGVTAMDIRSIANSIA